MKQEAYWLKTMGSSQDSNVHSDGMVLIADTINLLSYKMDGDGRADIYVQIKYIVKLSDGSFAYGCADIGISDSILYRHDTDTEQ